MKRPNVVLFMTDGHRADMLGCYGNRNLHTPNIDGLAREGSLFRRAFCTHSVCMPTRASVYTGRYPHVHGVWANGVPLPASETTLPQILRENGYATGASGKIHFEPQQAYMRQPAAIADGVRALSPLIDTARTPYYGFDEVHLSENLLGEEYVNFIRENHPEWAEGVLARSGVPAEIHELKWITDRALDFIRRQAEQDTPFFCHCSYHELSPPCSPPLEFDGHHDPKDMPVPVLDPADLDGRPPFYRQCYEGYLARGRHPDENQLRQAIAGCYDQMRFIDLQFGRIVDQLKELGMWEQTIVLFTADHGLSLNDHWQWRHGPFLFDEVINVPMIWHVPGGTRGKETGELVEGVDIMPTILDLCGFPNPDTVQGISMAALARGEPGAHGRESVLIQERQAPDLTVRGVDPAGITQVGLRTKDWKIIRYAHESYGELYDLTADPGEFTNLWENQRARKQRRRMESMLLDRLYESAPPLPERPYDW